MSSFPCPLRLTEVKGFGNRYNDIIYCPPKSPESSKAAVYFGGDVQDYPEAMECHRDNKHYIKWNLLSTALQLQSTFHDSHIIVIKPSRMELKTFACYDTFVPSNDVGAPEHVLNHNGLLHLQKLLQNVGPKIESVIAHKANQGTKTPAVPDMNEVDIQLIGFSKGCVPLNQFIYEFQYWKMHGSEENSVSTSALISHITDMYWLDGGHAGGKNTWITNQSILENLSKLGIRIHIHVTPYQVNDKRRPWIRKEEKLFYSSLQKFGAKVKRKLHFEDEIPTLEIHFGVLSEFRWCKRKEAHALSDLHILQSADYSV